MPSGFKILWTDHALSELSDTIKYLEENWTVSELIQFANAVDKTLEIISRHPDIFPTFNTGRKIRKAVVDKKQYTILSDCRGLNSNSFCIWNQAKP